MWTWSFWRQTAERAIRTFAQFLVMLWAADAGFNVLTVQWLPALGVAGGGALLSVLMSLAAGQVSDPAVPSFVDVPASGRHEAA